MMIAPETIALFGAALWALAALVTGIPRRRVPSEFPFLFSMIAVVGSLIGISEWVPEAVDVWVTGAAVTLYALTPVVFTIWLLHRYEPEDRDRGNPRTVTEQHNH